MLYPTKSPDLILAKRATAVMLLLGVCTILGAFILWYLGHNMATAAFPFIVGFLSVLVAGAIGGHVEKEAKKEYEARKAAEEESK